MSLPDYQPKRLGLKFDPPTIVLEYLVPSTGKLYHHRMKVRNLTASSNLSAILEHLKQRHALYFNNKIADDQIIGLLRRLQDSVKPSVDYETLNLNKLTPEEVQKHKDKMDVLFRQNQMKPGDPGFVYDVQRNFDAEEDNSWDEYEDDFED